MKMLYISHPYTGNEQQNLQLAEEVAAKLAKEFQHILFINPLNSMRHLKTAELEYDVVLAQCIELLDRCDGIIMAGNWVQSRGCREEYNHAIAHNKLVFLSVDEFIKRCENG